MPKAEEHLLKKQVLKLLQCVSLKDVNQITKLINFGIPGLVNYSGILQFLFLSIHLDVIYCAGTHLIKLVG